MPKQVTKAADNVYCQARLRAAHFNDDFATRKGAVEHLPSVTEDSLKKYELDINRPPNDVIALMADAYNAPELRTWYCGNECPLGKHLQGISTQSSQHAFVRLINALNDVDKLLVMLASVMDDGKITNEAERRQIDEVEKQLLTIYRRTNENLAMIEKAKKTGQF